MVRIENRILVKAPAALEVLGGLEALEQRRLRVDQEIRDLLAPVKDRLRELVLEHDQLGYEAIAARREFFRLAKQADPSLSIHGSLRYERQDSQVFLVWDDAGPRFLASDGAEPPEPGTFRSRAPDRRAFDLTHWLS